MVPKSFSYFPLSSASHIQLRNRVTHVTTRYTSRGPLLEAAIRSSVPKLPKRHAKTLQTTPTAQLTLIEDCQPTNWCLLAVQLAMSCCESFSSIFAGCSSPEHRTTYGISWMASEKDIGVYLSFT